METVWIILIILVLVVIVLMGAGFESRLRNRNGGKKILTAIPDFEPTKKWINGLNGVGLAVDVERKKLALIEKRGSCSVLEFQKILAVEVCKNGTSLISLISGSRDRLNHARGMKRL
jgi:hypothetical protein